jgi:hypothetical protein
VRQQDRRKGDAGGDFVIALQMCLSGAAVLHWQSHFSENRDEYVFDKLGRQFLEEAHAGK